MCVHGLVTPLFTCRSRLTLVWEDDDTGAFKQSLPPHIRASLKNKRILLFKEMLEAAHYPDKAVADDMASGFNLVGHLELPAGWAPDFRPASISASDLAALSRDGNQQIIRDVASSSSFTEELWQKSMEEVSKGWSEDIFGACAPQVLSAQPTTEHPC